MLKEPSLHSSTHSSQWGASPASLCVCGAPTGPTVLRIPSSLLFLRDNLCSYLCFSANLAFSRGPSASTHAPEPPSQHSFLELTPPPATAHFSPSAGGDTSSRSCLGLQSFFPHFPVSVLPYPQTALVKVPVASAWPDLAIMAVFISVPSQQREVQ